MLVFVNSTSFPTFNQARKYAKKNSILEINVTYPNYKVGQKTVDEVVMTEFGPLPTGRKVTEYITEEKTFTYTIEI